MLVVWLNSYPNSPIIGHLSINNLQSKIVNLREIIEKLKLDAFFFVEGPN